jgi:hypothetical protein
VEGVLGCGLKPRQFNHQYDDRDISQDARIAGWCATDRDAQAALVEPICPAHADDRRRRFIQTAHSRDYSAALDAGRGIEFPVAAEEKRTS